MSRQSRKTQYDQEVQLVARTMHDNDTIVAFRRNIALEK